MHGHRLHGSRLKCPMALGFFLNGRATCSSQPKLIPSISFCLSFGLVVDTKKQEVGYNFFFLTFDLILVSICPENSQFITETEGAPKSRGKCKWYGKRLPLNILLTYIRGQIRGCNPDRFRKSLLLIKEYLLIKKVSQIWDMGEVHCWFYLLLRLVIYIAKTFVLRLFSYFTITIGITLLKGFTQHKAILISHNYKSS